MYPQGRADHLQTANLDNDPRAELSNSRCRNPRNATITRQRTVSAALRAKASLAVDKGNTASTRDAPYTGIPTTKLLVVRAVNSRQTLPKLCLSTYILNFCLFCFVRSLVQYSTYTYDPPLNHFSPMSILNIMKLLILLLVTLPALGEAQSPTNPVATGSSALCNVDGAPCPTQSTGIPTNSQVFCTIGDPAGCQHGKCQAPASCFTSGCQGTCTVGPRPKTTGKPCAMGVSSACPTGSTCSQTLCPSTGPCEGVCDRDSRVFCTIGNSSGCSPGSMCDSYTACSTAGCQGTCTFGSPPITTTIGSPTPSLSTTSAVPLTSSAGTGRKNIVAQDRIGLPSVFLIFMVMAAMIN